MNRLAIWRNLCELSSGSSLSLTFQGKIDFEYRRLYFSIPGVLVPATEERLSYFTLNLALPMRGEIINRKILGEGVLSLYLGRSGNDAAAARWHLFACT